VRRVSFHFILICNHQYATYGAVANNFLLRRYGYVDVSPLPTDMVKKFNKDLKVWPFGNIWDDFDIPAEAIITACREDYAKKYKSMERQMNYYLDLLQRGYKWEEVPGNGE
jgi:hypothetical protein